MKNTIIILLLLAVGWLGIRGCNNNTATDDSQSLQEAIDAFYAAIEYNDIDARISLFADDAIIMPNHWTATRGKSNIEPMLRASGDAVFKIKDREVLDIDFDGSLAYTINSYYRALK